jgi:molybdopterin molybdotransferase
VASGDPLPTGADAVVRLEHAMPEPPAAVAVIAPVFAGSEVERRGSHVASGGALLPAASRPLDAADLGLLAAAGLARVPVIRRPRVRLLLAADKLVEAGQPVTAGQVYNAAGPMLAALVERDGGSIVASHHLGPAAEGLRNGLPGADIVLVVGGTGPGSNDHAAAALAEVGALAMHGVAIQPGGTAGGGRIDSVPVLLLPGPPAHGLWAYELIAGRAIRRMAGRRPGLPYRMETLRISRKIVSEVGTLEVWPVRRIGTGEVEPMPSLQEAGLAAAAHADGYILVPETSEGYPQAALVPVYLRA